MTTKVPSIPSVTSSNLLEVSKAVKSLLDVREGVVGDPLDSNVTFRDLVDAGAVTLRPGWNQRLPVSPVMPSWADPDGYDPVADLTPPPKPENVTATGLFALVQLQWDRPTYRNHAYAEIWRSNTNSIGNAIRIGTSNTSFYADNLGASATRYYWVRFVSQANVIGPYNATDGLEASTATDPGLVIESLTGQITEAQLYSTLGARIDLIDGPSSMAGSVNYRLGQEAAARASAISTESQLRNAAILSEANTRAQAILDEALARANGDSALQTQINTLVAASSGDFQDLIAAVQEEQTARIAGDTAEATARQTLATQLRGSYDGTDPSLLTTGLLYNERQTRITAEGVISSNVTALQATVANNFNTLNSAITTEQTARANADAALTNSFNGLSATVGTKTSTFYQTFAPTATATGDIWFDSDDSNKPYRWGGTSWVAIDDPRISSTAAALTTEQTTRAEADTALSNSITQLTTTVNNNYTTLNSAITSEATARSTADQTLTNSITSLTSTVNNNKTSTDAAIQSEASTRASADSSLSTQINTLTATFSQSNLGKPLTQWTLNGHSVVTLTDGRVGKNALRLSTAAGYPNQGYYVPIDRTKKYKVRFWARPTSTTNGLLYFSLRQFLNDTGTAGPTNSGRSPYKPNGISRASHNTTYGGTDQWGEYSFIWGPTDWQTGVTYVMPEFLNNYNGTAGHWDIQDFTFTEVTAQEELGAAIEAESTARATAISAEATSRNTLATQLRGSYTGTDVTQLTAGLIFSERQARVSADSVLSTSIDQVSARLNSGGDIYSSLVTAQNTASAKSANFVQSTAPTATKVNDLWIDTANGNILKRWNGSSWVNADDTRIGATATSVTQLSARLNDTGNGVAMEQRFTAQASSITGLEGKYSVKIDVAGHVSGFGLLSTANNATPTSEFGVRADRFFIAAPATSSSTAPTTGLYKGRVWVDTSVTPNVTRYYTGSAWTTTPQNLPFIVQTSPTTINGVAAPAGVYIDTAFIRDGTITTAKIGNAQIDDAKIANIDATKITTGFLSADRIQAGTLDAKIANIDAAKITSGTIGVARIGDATISTAKIANGAITNAKIGNAEITGAKIASATITAANIAYATITSAEIGFGTITGANIASATIGSANIANAAITNAKIQDAAITSAKIGTAEVTTLKIGANQVTIPSGADGQYSALVTVSAPYAITFFVLGVFTQGQGRAGQLWQIFHNGSLLRQEAPAEGTTGAMARMVSAAAGTHSFSISTPYLAGDANCNIVVFGAMR